MLMSRISGVLMIGVFLLNVYIGVGDTVIRSVNPAHYYLNWLIAVVDIVAAIILFIKPLSTTWVSLAGIAWPVVYVLSLAVDVYTYLCLGGSASCTGAWPTHRSAFDYLILNDPAQGWVLFRGTVPLIIALLFIVFVLSILSVYNERKLKRLRVEAATGGTQPTTAPASKSPSSPQNSPPSSSSQ